MNLTSFVAALVALIAAFYGTTYEETSAQIAAALKGGKTTGDKEEILWMSEPGNGYSETFNNTGLPNIPTSWDKTSYVFSVGATNGMALRGRTGLNNKTGIISRISWYVASMGMLNDKFISLNVIKPKSSLAFFDGATPIIAYTDLYYNAGALKVRTRYATDGGEVIASATGTVSPGTVFQTYLEVNLITDRIIARFNTEEYLNVAMDATLLQTSMQTVDTAVIGASGGSTGRDIVVLADEVLEHIIPNQGVAPSNSRITSPVNGATNQEVTVPINCAADNGPTGYEIRVETVNPPVGAWFPATNGVFNPTTLLNGTTYYSQCRTTNQHGTSPISSVSSFTTITPASTTTTDPMGIVTAGRQSTWSTMRGDYLKDTTCLSYALDSNSRLACEFYDLSLKVANNTITNFDGGLTAAWLSNVPGEDKAAWCTKSYNTSVSNGFLSYTNGANVGPNERREYAIDWLIQLNLCYGTGGWTQIQSDLFMTKLNEMTTNISKIVGSNGWRCSDIDQPIAEYFFLTGYYLGFEDINPTIKTIWETTRAAQIGGLSPTPPLNCALANVGNTARNLIARLYGSDWQGGSSTEGSMYGLSVPFLGLQGCEALRALSALPCAEIDTYTDDSARYFPQLWTRDYKAYFQDGDNQEPHRLALPRFRIDQVHHVLMLTGTLPDGADRQNLWRWYKNFRAANGSSLALPNGLSGPGRSLMWANPYITASANLSSLPKCFTSNAGIYIYNDQNDVSTASQIWWRFNVEDPVGLDHTQEKFSDVQFWHKNEYALTHLLGYGANDILPEGSNAFYVEGLPMFPRSFSGPGKQYRKVNGNECLSNGMYVAGTNGGLLHGPGGYEGSLGYYDPPPKAVDEFSQSYIGLVSADKKYTVVFNMTRIRAVNPESLTKFTRYMRGLPECNYLVTCYRSHSYMLAEQQHIQDYPRWTAFLQQWTDTLPTVDNVNKITSWQSLTGYNVKDFWLSPTTVNIDLHRVDSKIEFGLTTNGGDGIPYNIEKKHRTVIESNIADVEWNPIQRAVIAYDTDATAPVFTVLAPTGGCGAVLMQWGTNSNVLFIFNTTQGAAIPQSFPTQAQAAAVLATARFQGASSCTVNWNSTTSTTQILVVDRLPSLAWTYNLNAAGAVALDETASGFKELSASGIQAHSIVIAGS